MTPDECCQAAQAASPTPDWCPEEVPRTTCLSAAHPWLADRGQPTPDRADDFPQLLVHRLHGLGWATPLWQVVQVGRAPDGSDTFSVSFLNDQLLVQVLQALLLGDYEHGATLPDPDHLRAWSDYCRQVIVQTLQAHGLYQEADLL